MYCVRKFSITVLERHCSDSDHSGVTFSKSFLKFSAVFGSHNGDFERYSPKVGKKEAAHTHSITQERDVPHSMAGIDRISMGGTTGVYGCLET